MSRPRARHALAGFLDRFTSRRSELDGYWLFGFLVQLREPPAIEIDLLGDTVDAVVPISTAIRIARARFFEQLAKSGLDRTVIAAAHVRIAPDGTIGRATLGRGDVVPAIGVVLVAAIRLASGAEVSFEKRILVAPHDERREMRSRRAPSG